MVAHDGVVRTQAVSREALAAGLRGQGNRRLLAWPGACAVCGLTGKPQTVYIERNSWSRDHLRCVRCQAMPRERCLALALERARPEWRTLVIHESSPGPRGLSRALRRECPSYTSSQYLQGEAPGSVVSQVRNEDLGALTFPDDSIDILVTQDVLEHVMHPERVFAETRRVLRSGGLHLATFPWSPDIASTRRRAEIGPRGELVHHLEPEYHGNPIGDGRSLVTIDWGADVFDIAAENGFDLTVVKMPFRRHYGIAGEYREVFAFRPR